MRWPYVIGVLVGVWACTRMLWQWLWWRDELARFKRHLKSASSPPDASDGTGGCATRRR